MRASLCLVAILLAGCSGLPEGESFYHDEGDASVAMGEHRAWTMDPDGEFDLHPRVTNLGGGLSGLYHFDAYLLDAAGLADYLAGDEFDVVTGTDGPCKWEDRTTTAAPCRDVAPGTYTFIVDNTDKGATAPEGDLRLDYEIDARPA